MRFGMRGNSISLTNTTGMMKTLFHLSSLTNTSNLHRYRPYGLRLIKPPEILKKADVTRPLGGLVEYRPFHLKTYLMLFTTATAFNVLGKPFNGTAT